MTRAELREAVGNAIAEADMPCDFPAWKRRVADAALRVVREAMREPDGVMVEAGAQDTNAAMGDGTREARHVWRAMLAASPLREE